mmetsp:Transcript_25815/g.56609  ORF Transcript_25815/g.56609 Transcript_25815/m.56609 type:complete len:201 (-) Transcript_25815:434-1036(-)
MRSVACMPWRSVRFDTSCSVLEVAGQQATTTISMKSSMLMTKEAMTITSTPSAVTTATAAELSKDCLAAVAATSGFTTAEIDSSLHINGTSNDPCDNATSKAFDWRKTLSQQTVTITITATATTTTTIRISISITRMVIPATSRTRTIPATTLLPKNPAAARSVSRNSKPATTTRTATTATPLFPVQLIAARAMSFTNAA